MNSAAVDFIEKNGFVLQKTLFIGVRPRFKGIVSYISITIERSPAGIG
jgi:hypothetical protein